MIEYDRVQRTAEWLRSRGSGSPDVAIVLGSGLGDFADRLGQPVEIAYGEIPGWPAATVVGHAGRLVFGTVAGRQVAALSGR
ncbi:MAG TPA: hypothetical protein VLD67_21525, partial [Vicinamibacterales bacterium]|nr:hypothetical protein [Vicinamibacterales bacterium]